MANLHQYTRESIADFVFHFHATCPKIADLAEAEKLDRFVRALVLDVRMQVELQGPQNFHNAVMYAERADAILLWVSSQDSQRNWHKQQRAASRDQ